MNKALVLEWIGMSGPDAGLAPFSKIRKPWVARITGTDGPGGIGRNFLDGAIDFAESNAPGSRGVTLTYILPPGYYEIRSFRSWRGEDRYFARVNDSGGLERIARSELLEWAEEEQERRDIEERYGPADLETPARL